MMVVFLGKTNGCNLTNVVNMNFFKLRRSKRSVRVFVVLGHSSYVVMHSFEI